MTSTGELKAWMSILLFATLFLIKVESQTGDTENDLLIFRALEKALLTEKNLYVLQNKLYTGLMKNSYFYIVIYHEDFIVKNMPNAKRSGYYYDFPAFKFNENCSCYKRADNLYPCQDSPYDQIRVSSPAEFSLSEYIIGNCKSFVVYLDISFFQLLDNFANISQRQSEDGINDKEVDISLIVEYLPVNITGYDLEYALLDLLKWVKYYARTGQSLSNSNQILDTDITPVEYICGEDYIVCDNSLSLLIPTAVICLNFAIMITGCYIILKLSSGTIFLNLAENIFTTINAKIVIFWPVAMILFLVNIICFVYEWCYVVYEWYYDLQFSPYYYFYANFNVPLICFFTLIEICVIHYMTRNVSTTDRFFCISRPKCFVRAIQTYATCNILWFAHRVGNCFLLSTLFIAVQPAPTLAAIALCINSIVIAILLAVAMTHLFLSHDRAKTFLKLSKLFVITFYLICIIGFITVYTLIFVNLTKHGLSASDIGTIILSLTVGSMTVFASIAGKRYFDKLNTGSNVLNNGYTAIQENN